MFLRNRRKKNGKDRERITKTENPKPFEISTKNPVTVEITGFRLWRRAWDSNT